MDKISVLIGLLLIVGCAANDYTRLPPADFPALQITTIQDDEAVSNLCPQSLLAQSFACATLFFDRLECRVVLPTYPPDWVRGHETDHCRGYDHIGDTTLRDAWEAHKKGVK